MGRVLVFPVGHKALSELDPQSKSDGEGTYLQMEPLSNAVRIQ